MFVQFSRALSPGGAQSNTLSSLLTRLVASYAYNLLLAINLNSYLRTETAGINAGNVYHILLSGVSLCHSELLL